MVKKASCPTCKENIELEKGLELHNTIQCPGCYEDLKLISLDPPTLELVYGGIDDYYGDGEDEDNDYDGRKKGGQWS